MIQVGNAEVWPDLLKCTQNVVEAFETEDGMQTHVYVTMHEDTPEDFKETVNRDLKKLRELGSLHIHVSGPHENRGADVGLFFEQMRTLQKSKQNHDLILKLHSKTDVVWRERALESLCGTKNHVLSLLSQFRGDPRLDMVAPLGTVFGPTTPYSQIFPHIAQKYNAPESGFPKNAFDTKTVHEMKRVLRRLNPKLKNKLISDEHMLIAAGTMFWVRQSALRVDSALSLVESERSLLTKGYKKNLGLEHIFERVFPTAIHLRGKRIGESQPAPKIMAMYFPQYHQIPENDRIWQEGFTEWTLLKPIKSPELMKPLSTTMGGLGYYDLLNYETRKKQAELARSGGVHGFVYYHYWFSGDLAPKDHKVMYKVMESMLADGEPNLPFMFSWANEPWTRRWTGGYVNASGYPLPGDTTLISQAYGDAAEWREHFEYLLPFFEHPNYAKVRGKPVFHIYRIGHIGETLRPMLRMWRELAIANGFPGLHIVSQLGSFRVQDKLTIGLENEVDASFHFWPNIQLNYQHNKKTSSLEDIPLNTPVQYWGGYRNFDRRVRDSNIDQHDTSRVIALHSFLQGVSCSMDKLAGYSNRSVDQNFYFINAWNEWNEQAVLEPDSRDQFGALTGLHKILVNLPVRYPLEKSSTFIGPECYKDKPFQPVAVIIRVYVAQLKMMEALMMSMVDMKSRHCYKNCVRFILVPTEFDSVKPVIDAVDRLKGTFSNEVWNIRIVQQDQNWFEQQQQKNEVYGCFRGGKENTTAFVNGICGVFPFENCRYYLKKEKKEVRPLANKINKICYAENHIHYTLTDIGLRMALDSCKDNPCSHVVVTNADNMYHKDFLKEATQYNEDFVALDYATDMDSANSRTVKVDFQKYNLDLGAVVLKASMLERTGINFMSSMPHEQISEADLTDTEKGVATMRAFNDLDNHFFRRGVEKLALSHRMVHKMYFFHQ
jgi:hypothetical protein